MAADTKLRDFLTLALQSFLTAKESEGCSPRTVDAYTRALDRFVAYLREHGVTDPAQVSPTVVRAYFAELGKQDYESSYVHHLARPVKTMLRFWYADGLTSQDVMAKVKLPKLDKRILPAFTQADVKTLLKGCKDNREKALLLFLLDTGVRAAELCQLRVGDLDASTGAAMVRLGKGGKDRTVYIGAQARLAVLRYLRERETTDTGAPLFPSERDGAPLTPNGLLQLLRRIGKRTGVANCHPHTFRRTCAIFSLRAGMDLQRLAALLGHADLTVLRQYLDLVENDIEEAHRQYGAVAAIMDKKGAGHASARR